MSGQDVDAGHVGIVAAGHEGGAGRVEQGVAAGEILGAAPCRPARRRPRPRRRCGPWWGVEAWALHPADVDLEPAQALFGHFDVRARGGTGVRHDVEIVSTQETLPFGESRVALQHMGQAVVVAAFLVGHEHQAQAEFGGDVAGMQGFGQQQHAHQALLVVLHTASDEHVALPDHLPGIGMATGPGHRAAPRPCGQKARASGRNGRGCGPPRWGAAGGHARIGGIQTADVAHPAGAQAVFDIQGLGQLALAAVFRAQGTEGGQVALKGRHTVLTLIQPAQEGGQGAVLRTCVHAVFP